MVQNKQASKLANYPKSGIKKKNDGFTQTATSAAASFQAHLSQIEPLRWPEFPSYLGLASCTLHLFGLHPLSLELDSWLHDLSVVCCLDFSWLPLAEANREGSCAV